MEFTEVQSRMIIDAYRATDDETLVAAGVVNEQLWSKIVVPRAAADDLDHEVAEGDLPIEGKPKYLGTSGVRRWIKRVQVLVRTLKGILPAAQALAELLDLLNVALDRPPTRRG
jgi:hypothetical protein